MREWLRMLRVLFDDWFRFNAMRLVPVSRTRYRELEAENDRQREDMGRLIRALADTTKTLVEHGLLVDTTEPPA